MKGGEIATCPTFHMGKGQWLTRVNAIVIDNSLKKKNQKTKNKPGFWVLVTSNIRRNEQNGKMEGGRKR